MSELIKQTLHETAAEPTSDELFDLFLAEAFMRGSQDITRSLAFVFARVDVLQDSATSLAQSVTNRYAPLPRPQEYGVRVVREAMPTNGDRLQLITETTAFLVTSDSQGISPEQRLIWSIKAVEYIAALMTIDAPVLLAEESAAKLAAAMELKKALYGHIRREVDLMAECTEETELAARLAHATAVANLADDIIEVVTAED